MLYFKSISNFPVKYCFLFIFFISCKTVLPLDTTTGFTQPESCNEVVYDPKYDNRGEDLAATSEFITRQYFDIGNIYSDEDGIYDPVDIQFLTTGEINTEIDKELKKIEGIHLIEEITGIEGFKTKKIKSLQIKRELMILIKESFKSPEILKSNELTKNEANLNLIFEKDQRKLNKNFSEYFSRYGDYGKIYLKKIKKNKTINKVNELIVFSIFHSKLNELSDKEREINYAMYQEYKKLYRCKE